LLNNFKLNNEHVTQLHSHYVNENPTRVISLVKSIHWLNQLTLHLPSCTAQCHK